MINLLPDDIKTARRYATLNRKISQYFVLVFVVISLLIGAYGFGYVTLTNERKKVEDIIAVKSTELTDLDSLSKEAQSISDTISTAATLLGREIRFSELIQKIGSVMPEGARLNGLSLTGDKTSPLEIQAVLKNPEQAGVLQNNLLTLDLFEAADIQDVQTSVIVDEQTKAETRVVTSRLSVSFKATKTKATPTATPTPAEGATQ
jgi:hypothetical protein